MPSSSLLSGPALGRTKLRFAFPKKHETLDADHLARIRASQM